MTNLLSANQNATISVAYNSYCYLLLMPSFMKRGPAVRIKERLLSFYVKLKFTVGLHQVLLTLFVQKYIFDHILFNDDEAR